MATKYYCSRYEKEVELYDNHCLGCSLFPFNVGECPSRINLDKSYTDVEQSQKLAEILPLESADMHSEAIEIDGDMVFVVVCGPGDKNKSNYGSPVWSLAALLKLIPNFNIFKRTIECKIETTKHSINKACNLVDAAFEMVCWLKENNKL